MRDRIVDALKKQKSVKDNFRSQNGYSWDYVIVFKIYGPEQVESEKQIKYNMKHILNQLADAGLETKLFYNVKMNQVFCKIRCPLKRLMKEADRTNYKLLLDSER
jgi:anoctamin-10/anoctamin-7